MHQHAPIANRCPSCGNATLFIGSGGWLVCSWLRCKSPGLEDFLPRNRLTAAEAELFALLGEELAEAQQAVGKILRHGKIGTWYPLKGIHPGRAQFPHVYENLKDLQAELGHVSAATKLLVNHGLLKQDVIGEYMRAKLESIGEFLHHQQAQERTNAAQVSIDVQEGSEDRGDSGR